MTTLALGSPAEQDLDADLVPLLNRMLLRYQTQQSILIALDRYYEGRQPLAFLAPEVREQIGNRLSPLVINWPRTIVDSVRRRTYPEGFRLGQGGEADLDLWRIWQESNMDRWGQLGFVDSLVHGRSFVSVWNPDGGDTPKIAVESARQAVVEYIPGTDRLRAGFKVFDDYGTTRAQLLLPDRIIMLESTEGLKHLIPPPDGAPPVFVNQGTRFHKVEELENPLGVVPMVPLVNRPRTTNLDGESELADVIPLADAVNKLATDMMVTSEFHASKRRYATGIEIPAGWENRERLRAEVQAEWDQATKGKTWLAPPGVQFGQFDEASLDNFVNAIGMLTGQIAAIAGLPPHYLGISTANPASAEAIRSAESTLVERAREKQRIWGDALEEVMRLAVAARDGMPVAKLPSGYSQMETIWRDPETPTEAQTGDFAVKMLGANVFDLEAAQEHIGLTPTQREAIAVRARTNALQAVTNDIEARVDLALKFVAEKGMDFNVALAVVGLAQGAVVNKAIHASESAGSVSATAPGTPDSPA